MRSTWRASRRLMQWAPERSVFAPAPASKNAAESYESDSFHQISAVPFEEKVAAKLMRPVTESQVEIKPDGLIYLPEIHYRRTLNEAFGPGGWALMPRGEPKEMRGMLVREYALFAYGRFVSQAAGEEAVSEVMGPSTAIESLKSQAMMRCCKDLGVASQLWDPAFITAWKSRHAVAVRCEHVATQKRRVLWRRADRPPFDYPWKELAVVSAARAPIAAETEDESLTAPLPTLDFDANTTLVPPVLKKFAGRTFAEVLQDERGPSYLEWVVENFDGEIRDLVRKALNSK